MKEETIRLDINDRSYQVVVSRKTMLLDVLRDQLRLTGTKNGCGHNACGACKVIVDGEAVNSCVYPAKRAMGKKIETIEGLARDDKLHPLQEAFVRRGAVQCGFCTPGFIMAAKALLDRNPRPAREEIVEALAGNLCRCTGYTKVIEAVEEVAGLLIEAKPPLLEKGPLRAVGLSLPRPDALEKVTGKAIYAADLYFDDMLYAKVLRSRYPHARLVKIDIGKAKALPGLAAVLTAEDIPGEKNHGLARLDWPVLAYDKVRYLGDAIAIVAAETEEIAEEALELIEVEYEPLPVVGSPEEALEPGAPPIHEEGNILEHIKVRKGDVEEGFSQAEIVVEGEFWTPSSDHCFLEPEAGVAAIDGDGITVYVGSQIPFADRRQIAASLAIPEEKVRVIQTRVGGAFGGKEDISVQIHAALLAQATGRPVKLVWSRRESMTAHPKRHQTSIWMKTGATREGKLLAVEARILGDSGAYASLGPYVMTRAATHATGPYEVPHVKIDCYAMYTNNPPAGAYRGFGVPQTNLAAESQMDILAHELDLDPLELRRWNALRVGSVTATGQVLRDSVGLARTIDKVAQATEGWPAWAEAAPEGKRRGWGVACAYKNVGLGGSAPDSAGATVEVLEEGQVEVRAGAAEVGQGIVAVLAQVVAEELGFSHEKVKVLVADTALTPNGGATTASRQSFITGNAARLAAQEVKRTLAGVVGEALSVPTDSLIFEGERIQAEDGHSLTLREATRLAKEKGKALLASSIYTAPRTVNLGENGDAHFAYGYATQAAQVEVDITTGEVKVVRVVAAHDVGRAINPLAIEGQLEGGVLMGLGFALMEGFSLKEGIPQKTTFTKYRIPTAKEVPEIIPIIVEEETSEGPYGAKGVGEITSIPTCPAIINAIYDALGVRIRRLPATSERVLAALERTEGL